MGGWSSRNGKDSDRCYGWRCTCGAHSPGAFNVDLTRTEVDASRFSHEADALAPLLDEWSAQDRAEALREAAEAWGGGMVGKWLNDRAGDIPRNGPAEVWDEGFNAGFLIGGEAARREPTSRIFNPYRAALAPSTPRRTEPGVQDCAVKVWGNSDDEQWPCTRPAAQEWLDLTGNWVPICESHAGRGIPADRLRPLSAEPGVQGGDGEGADRG
jgi:hypothetical protein